MKRYLGLKRLPLQKIGALEIITPRYLSGWVFLKDENLTEVYLYIGANIIAKAPVNIKRPDVSSIYPNANNPGFQILLPLDMPPINLNEDLKLIAKNSKGVGVAEIKILGNYDQKIKLLKDLFKSNLLGLDGNVDGIRKDGKIHGWARRSHFKGPIKIWMQCDGCKPIGIFCDHYRDDIKTPKVDKYCGLQFDLKQIPSECNSKKIKFSFDENGKFLLPQSEDINLSLNHNNQKENEIQINLEKNSLEYNKNAIPEELKPHWEDIENFNKLLDVLEEKLIFEKIKNSYSIKKRIQNLFIGIFKK